MQPARERRVLITWQGDEFTEAAVLKAAGYQMPFSTIAKGFYERWIQVPATKRPAVREAIVDAGGRLL